MKFLKALGILLLVMFAIATILTIALPVKQETQRSILINASPPVVYEYLSRLSNFKNWSVWNQQDSTLVNSITGTDGALGAVNSWKGDPELSGEGQMQITSLEINKEIEHKITYTSPRKLNASSEFDLAEVNGQTKLTWTIKISTPRPWNIANLFTSMDDEMGNDFDKSLLNLKSILEKKTAPLAGHKSYEVLPMNFPSTSYAVRRQLLKWHEMTDFFGQQLPYLYEQAMQAKATAGSPSGLFYVWDEQNQQTDLSAAMPVAQGTVFSDTSIKVVDLAGSKAVYVNYYGAYDKVNQAYASLEEYVASNNLKRKLPVIEQYITDPRLEKDTSKWLTKIIFLVE